MAGEQKYKIADPLQARRVGALVAGLSPDSGPWEVVIKKWRKQRTLSQNALYWKWLEIIGGEVGEDKDELHDIFREKFLPWEIVEVCGVKKKRLTRTSDPDFVTNHMAAYMTHIERFANTELGILLPHPEDDHYQTISR